MLANHKNGIFPLKRAFLDEIQRPVKRLSNQIASKVEDRLNTYLQLTYMLHYKIHGFLRFSFERAAMKTKGFSSIWKVALAPFAPL